MKHFISVLSILLIVLFVVASCGSPYKKRKRCRGNGSWYGNRNLGAINQKTEISKDATIYYVEKSDMTVSAN